MATKKEIERQEALSHLAEWKDEILAPSSLLEFRTEYGKGQTDYVSVHLYYVKDGEGRMANLTYNVGRACGYSFRRSEYKNQLALGGGNYSKSFDVALAMFRALEIDHKEEKVNFEYR